MDRNESPKPRRSLLTIFVLVLIVPISIQSLLRAQTPLRVAAAADLEPVLPPILVQFEKNTGVHAEATYQASAMLTAQIENGAPFDLFLSADLGYPKRLIGDGLADVAGSADPSTPITYAKGTLVLWVRKIRDCRRLRWICCATHASNGSPSPILTALPTAAPLRPRSPA